MQVQIASSFLIIFIFRFKDTSLYFLAVSFGFTFFFLSLLYWTLMNELRDHGSRMNENDISALLRRFVFHTETSAKRE